MFDAESVKGWLVKKATFTNAVYTMVCTIALLSFAMSYSVLSEDAKRHGVRLYHLFPIVLDASVAVFLAFWVWAGNNQRLAWQGFVSVTIATAVSILLNISHVIEWQNRVMTTVVMVLYFVIPPVALFAASHFVAEMYKVSTKERLTDEQTAAIQWLSGKLTNEEYAERVGVKPSALKGWARKMRVQ